MYKHILLPVEFGSADDYQRAYDIASALLDAGGKITVMHAIEPLPTYVDPYIPPEVTAKSYAGLKEKLGGIASALGTSDTALVHGSAGRAIVDWADENGADCIVITSHRPAFSDLFLGSTAAWVVRHAAMAVHVVR